MKNLIVCVCLISCWVDARADAILPLGVATHVAHLQQSGAKIDEIYRVEYKQGIYFYLAPRCCDIPGELIDDQGAHVCFPTGGFASDSKGCKDFSADTQRMQKIVLPDEHK